MIAKIGKYSFRPFNPVRHAWEKDVGPSLMMIDDTTGEGLECELSKIEEWLETFFRETM